MFQNVNVTESAPFALLTIYQKKIRTIRAINYIPKKKKKKKILVSLQSFQNCPPPLR